MAENNLAKKEREQTVIVLQSNTGDTAFKVPQVESSLVNKRTAFPCLFSLKEIDSSFSFQTEFRSSTVLQTQISVFLKQFDNEVGNFLHTI